MLDAQPVKPCRRQSERASTYALDREMQQRNGSSHTDRQSQGVRGTHGRAQTQDRPCACRSWMDQSSAEDRVVLEGAHLYASHPAPSPPEPDGKKARFTPNSQPPKRLPERLTERLTKWAGDEHAPGSGRSFDLGSCCSTTSLTPGHPHQLVAYATCGSLRNHTGPTHAAGDRLCRACVRVRKV